jgi:hypothetical protein
MDYGTLPQWVTGGVAVAAGIIAIWNIRSQREIARKRAAFDVFLKTETDEKMLTAYDNFHAGIIEMEKATSIEEFCTSALTRPQYLWIRKYLNVHELIAVGIRENVLDSNVCYSYWADALTNGCSDASPVLDFVRDRPRNKYTYSDLAALNAKWLTRKKKATQTGAPIV